MKFLIQLQIRHDGTDIILVDLASGESVIIYLIERLLTVSELKLTLTENTEANLYTLFILWGDMLLPQEGSNHIPEDWKRCLRSTMGKSTATIPTGRMPPCFRSISRSAKRATITP